MMMLYMTIWFICTLFIGFEFWALAAHPDRSLLLHLQQTGIIPKTLTFSVGNPGHSISLWAGWVGLSLMICMNVYTLRKKIGFMRHLGSLKSYLDFHVFCGILGPTLIVFHSNFKVRGLVAISFWSMIVSLSSGLIGRYFYVQLLTQKSDLNDTIEFILKRLDASFKKRNLDIPQEERQHYLGVAMQLAGVPADTENVNLVGAFFKSIVGDMRLAFREVPVGPSWPKKLSPVLRNYAETRRRILFLEPFQRMMGYWHAFHFPFAIFMYVAAVIHVATALLMGV
jgi:hypothetical protein